MVEGFGEGKGEHYSDFKGELGVLNVSWWGGRKVFESFVVVGERWLRVSGD